MKKFGFTLSELIVAVSIVGVASALIAPVAGRLLPDTKKMTVLKYNALINNAIVQYYNSDNYRPSKDCIGLSCYQGEGDFETYLEDSLGLINGVTSDGISVTIASGANNDFIVTLDTDSNNNVSNVYDNAADNIGNVDTFRLLINEDGEVAPGDALTEAYFKSQYNANSKDKDIDEAKKNIGKQY